ncbi:MAG: helix-turn-helix domain-containing protein [Candidatus Rokubacteria bacterium]|nr:helix-turn-helix domain-containing protein [Candidatus Rokubacteria bacterium]
MTQPMTPVPIRPLLTVGELLRILPVGCKTLDRLVGTRQLLAIRIGRRRFFAPDDVERFLRSCSSTEMPEGEARR